MKNKKKIIAICTSLTAAAALIVGATLAYLHDTTETATNTFSSDKSISIQLREPTWDGYEFGDEGYNNGESAKTDSADLGFNMAKHYLPGAEIPKNPTVKNDGTQGESVYTALTVKYYQIDTVDGKDTAKQITYDAFKAAYLEENGIVFGNEWAQIDNKTGATQIYLYGKQDVATPLAIDTATPALFTTIPLSLNLEPDANGKMPKFKVQVQAYAIQTASIAPNEAAAQMLTFIGEMN